MFNELFKEIKIANLTIKNRFVMPAMDTRLTDGHHCFTKQAANYYAKRAEGGYGLQITEFLAVSENGIANKDQAAIYDDCFNEGLKTVVDKVHEYNGLIFAQLQHSGRIAQLENEQLELVGPSAKPYITNGTKVRQLLTEEIEMIEQLFVDAAIRAKKLGFDGVELHGAHGYLFDQFLSKASNNRTDIYGGSVSNRARIVCETIVKIKRACGKNYPVSVRINGVDPKQGGNTIEDAMAQALLIEKAGADVLNVSYGIPIESYYRDAGFNFDNVKKIKDILNIPVIGVGRINDPYLALAAIKGKYMDLVATGRQSISDPYFPNKIKENRIDEILRCTGCMQRCLYSRFFEEGYHGISCMNNPFAGKEGNWEIKETDKVKNIAIVGAGPAGMQAAWILAKRNHNVTLYEKHKMPGGQFILASTPYMKNDLANTITTYEVWGKKYGVRYLYGNEANKDVLENRYDVIIDATGSIPLIPGIDGIDNENVFIAQDVLSYKKQFMNKKLVVLGAGLVGAETAELLSQNNSVTLVDMLDKVAPLSPSRPRESLLEHLNNNNVEFILNSKVIRINNNGIDYSYNDQKKTLSGYDAVILAFGSRSNTQLKEQLQDMNIEYYAIGDSLKSGDAKKAIFEATELALKI